MELLPFDRDLPCPACGIRLAIAGVCREPHPDLVDASGSDAPFEHLHLACPGCGWSACMETAAQGDERHEQRGDSRRDDERRGRE